MTMIRQRMRLSLLFLLSCMCTVLLPSSAFVSTKNTFTSGVRRTAADINHHPLTSITSSSSSSSSTLKAYNDEENREEIEEARINIWKDRRGIVRSALRNAEGLRNFRLDSGLVPELGDDGEPIRSDGKTAVTFTAFAVAAGAIVLRVGGRAALVSAVGLDFVNDNPEVQAQMNQVLDYAGSVDPLLKAGLFCGAWTLVKTLCFDAGGIVLALSAGILFGGVLQGALMSAFGATVGSSVAFALAKLDTPVRKKAQEIVEKNPSLRGLEKVVAEEGLKAVLTLRLAPVLPIPLGMYNYVYGISNVPFLDFAGGIFLGSLKPYFLDSYLGYFGKSLVDGTANDGGLQDYLLIGVLGVSVLIGVFASQLASETWEAVLKEEEAEKEKLKLESGEAEDEDEGVFTEIFGWELPLWAVGFQYGLRDADERIEKLVLQEFDAKVWNCTKDDLPDSKNPALVDPTSPEITDRYKGVDFAATTCDGLVLSPMLFTYFLKFADPLFDERKFLEQLAREDSVVASATTASTEEATEVVSEVSVASVTEQKVLLLKQLKQLKVETNQRIENANKKLEDLEKMENNLE